MLFFQTICRIPAVHSPDGRLNQLLRRKFLRGKQVVIEDMVHDWTFEKDGGILLGENNGLWFQCGPWEYHIFKVTAK